MQLKCAFNLVNKLTDSICIWSSDIVKNSEQVEVLWNGLLVIIYTFNICEDFSLIKRYEHNYIDLLLIIFVQKYKEICKLGSTFYPLNFGNLWEANYDIWRKYENTL